MAEAAEPSVESQRAAVKTLQPVEKVLRVSPRRGLGSVLKVSQLLLGAIAAHKGLTLAALKKELGNAGYEVRRKICRQAGAGEAARPEARGTLLRVSGRGAPGYFRVWKVPKPRRKPERPWLQESRRPWRRSPLGPRVPRRRRPKRKAAEKARKVWRRTTRLNAKARRARLKAKELGRARAKRVARAKVTERKGRASMEDTRPGSRVERRPSSKLREEKQEPEKPVKRTTQKPPVVKSDSPSSGPGKARTKMSTKSEGPRNAVGNP